MSLPPRQRRNVVYIPPAMEDVPTVVTVRPRVVGEDRSEVPTVPPQRAPLPAYGGRAPLRPCSYLFGCDQPALPGTNRCPRHPRPRGY